MRKLSSTMLKSLTEQVNNEFKASCAYLHLFAWASYNHLPGIAKYFQRESKHEIEHGTSVLEFIVSRDDLPEDCPSFTTQTRQFENPLDVFSYYFDEECANLKSLQNLSIQALEEKDILTMEFLSPILQKQLEDVETAEVLLKKAKLVAEVPGFLYQLDSELEKKI